MVYGEDDQSVNGHLCTVVEKKEDTWVVDNFGLVTLEHICCIIYREVRVVEAYHFVITKYLYEQYLRILIAISKQRHPTINTDCASTAT